MIQSQPPIPHDPATRHYRCPPVGHECPNHVLDGWLGPWRVSTGQVSLRIRLAWPARPVKYPGSPWPAPNDSSHPHERARVASGKAAQTTEKRHGDHNGDVGSHALLSPAEPASRPTSSAGPVGRLALAPIGSRTRPPSHSRGQVSIVIHSQQHLRRPWMLAEHRLHGGVGLLPPQFGIRAEDNAHPP